MTQTIAQATAQAVIARLGLAPHPEGGWYRETWRDQEHQKFAQEFEQTVRVLEQFIRTSEQHSPFLLKKAQRLREYLNQR